MSVLFMEMKFNNVLSCVCFTFVAVCVIVAHPFSYPSTKFVCYKKTASELVSRQHLFSGLKS